MLHARETASEERRVDFFRNFISGTEKGLMQELSSGLLSLISEKRWSCKIALQMAFQPKISPPCVEKTVSTYFGMVILKCPPLTSLAGRFLTTSSNCSTNTKVVVVAGGSTTIGATVPLDLKGFFPLGECRNRSGRRGWAYNDTGGRWNTHLGPFFETLYILFAQRPSFKLWFFLLFCRRVSCCRSLGRSTPLLL